MENSSQNISNFTYQTEGEFKNLILDTAYCTCFDSDAVARKPGTDPVFSIPIRRRKFTIQPRKILG